MRTRVLLLITIFLSLSARAERPYGKNKLFAVNIYGGFTVPNNQYHGGSKLSGYTGLGYGLGIDIRPISEVALSIDFLHTTKGHWLSVDGSATRYEVNFLEFPVKIKLYPTNFLAFFVGPYLSGLVISAVRESDGGASSVKSEYKNDFGITWGVWLGIPASPLLTLGLDLRYDYGLADIEKDDNPSDKIYTRALLGLFTVTLTF